MTLRQAEGGRFGDAAARAWAVAATLLGWRPAEFWGATPAELAGAVVPPGDGEPPSKDMIDALMKRFPDRGE